MRSHALVYAGRSLVAISACMGARRRASRCRTSVTTPVKRNNDRLSAQASGVIRASNAEGLR